MSKQSIKWAIVACAILGSMLLSPGFAQEKLHPDLEKAVVLDLPPGEDNPRNSEGAFLTLKNGDILFVYTHYVGKSDSDHAPASLVARISRNKGETWSAEDREIVSNEGGMNIMSVSLLRMTDGRIALFYLRKNSLQDCRPWLRFSTDEGQTWSEPAECVTDEIGYYVLNNDRVMQQPDGTLLMALSLHPNKDGKFRGNADIFCYISRDKGQTWRRQKQVPNPDNITLQEPGLVQLDAETILMYIRSNAGCQCYSFSKDNGATWSAVEKSPLVAPLSPTVIKKIPGSNELLAIWNHNTGNRNPFNIAVLSPDAKTILVEKTLDFSPDNSHWFCYPALHFLDDGQFLAAYCAGDRRIVGLNATRLIKSSVANVRAGE